MCLFLCQYHIVLRTNVLRTSFALKLEVWSRDAPSFAVLSQDCFGYLGSLRFHTNVRVVCSSSVKNGGVLIGIALNVEIALGSIDILTMFVLSIHEHRMFFHFFVSSSVSFISVL